MPVRPSPVLKRGAPASVRQPPIGIARWAGHARKSRIDSTVVRANIPDPTEAPMPADGLRVMTRWGRRIRATLGAGGIHVVDRRPSVRRRLLAIGKPV